MIGSSVGTGAISAMTGIPSHPPKKKATHRGSRGGRNKKKGTNVPPLSQPHAEAKQHLANAQAAPSPEQAHAHLFKALTALNKAKAPAGTPQPSTVPQPDNPSQSLAIGSSPLDQNNA